MITYLKNYTYLNTRINKQLYTNQTKKKTKHIFIILGLEPRTRLT